MNHNNSTQFSPQVFDANSDAELLQNYENSLEKFHDKLLNDILLKQNPLYWNNFSYSDIEQKNLICNWLSLFNNGVILKDPSQYGFRAFSQTNEDGILLYIFTLIGTTNKKVIEIGVNCDNSNVNIPESISANLITYHGWQGLLIDAGENSTGQILHHFHLNKSTTYNFFNVQKNKANPNSSLFSPIIRKNYVTCENVNDLITENNFSGEVDLLSVDIDSFDYHVFDKISACNPRVFILETDGGKIDYETAVVVKYKSENDVDYKQHLELIHKYLSSGFSGTMSLAAAVKIAKKRGCRLVAVSSGGWNAFFVRNDIGKKIFPEISIENAYKKIPQIYSLKERAEVFNFKRLNDNFPNLFEII
jgi:hypothetical protein